MSERYERGQVTLSSGIVRIYVGGDMGYFHINPGGFCSYTTTGGNEKAAGEPVILTTHDLHQAIIAYATSKGLV